MEQCYRGHVWNNVIVVIYGSYRGRAQNKKHGETYLQIRLQSHEKLFRSHETYYSENGHWAFDRDIGGVQSDSKTIRSLMKSCLYFMKLGFY